MKPTIRVLFVCSANLCRSVTAVEYAQRAEASHRRCHGEAPRVDWCFESAGTDVMPDQRLPKPISDVMRDLGIPLRERPLLISESYVRSADLILTAERHHRSAVARRFPFAVRHTFTLLHFAELVVAGTKANQSRPISSASDILELVHAGRSNTPPVDDDTIDIADPVAVRSEAAMARCAETIAAAVDTVIGISCQVERDRGC